MVSIQTSYIKPDEAILSSHSNKAKHVSLISDQVVHTHSIKFHTTSKTRILLRPILNLIISIYAHTKEKE